MIFKKGENSVFTVEKKSDGKRIVNGQIVSDDGSTVYNIENCIVTGEAIFDGMVIGGEDETDFIDASVNLDEQQLDDETAYFKELAFIKQKIAKSGSDEVTKNYWTTIYQQIVDAHENKQRKGI